MSPSSYESLQILIQSPLELQECRRRKERLASVFAGNVKDVFQGRIVHRTVLRGSVSNQVYARHGTLVHGSPKSCPANRLVERFLVCRPERIGTQAKWLARGRTAASKQGKRRLLRLVAATSAIPPLGELVSRIG